MKVVTKTPGGLKAGPGFIRPNRTKPKPGTPVKGPGTYGGPIGIGMKPKPMPVPVRPGGPKVPPGKPGAPRPMPGPRKPLAKKV